MSLKQPVKYPVKYYSHLDAGAPQLADADGVIKAILKACLVTGYGDKTGAGWESLFEDGFRIVLRRPLQTGNPPDIKIENGAINGTDSHRIVSQYNPTGLDDATEIASVPILGKNPEMGEQWHMIVTDFAFVLCLQTANGSGTQNWLLHVGSAKKLKDSDAEYFFANYQSETASNLEPETSDWTQGYKSSKNQLRDMKTGATYNLKQDMWFDITEKEINGDYTAISLFIVGAWVETPFYVSPCRDYSNKNTFIVSIDNRQMLRYVNALNGNYDDPRIFYIPLDYWEL